MALAELKNSVVERRNFLAPSLKMDDQKFEFIVILDRSGSMSLGDQIPLARRALVLILRSLPATCIFNVYGFGTTFVKVFPSSVPYNQANLEHATIEVNKMTANLGGNSIHLPLQDIYSSQQTPGFLTQMFILHDGGESVEHIVRLIGENKTHARIFTLGIGEGAQKNFIDALAAAGGGTATYVSSREKIETKILEQLKIALRPSLLKPVMIV